MPDDGVQVKFVYVSEEEFEELDDKDSNTIYFVYSTDSMTEPSVTTVLCPTDS